MPDLPAKTKPKPCPKCAGLAIDLLTAAPDTSRAWWFRCLTCNYVWRVVKQPIQSERH